MVLLRRQIADTGMPIPCTTPVRHTYSYSMHQAVNVRTSCLKFFWPLTIFLSHAFVRKPLSLFMRHGVNSFSYARQFLVGNHLLRCFGT